MTEDLVAVGLLDGSVSLRRSSDLVEVAICPGHTGRTATLAFEGDWLVSGSWDGDVRSWSLEALDPDPDRLLLELQAAWGL
jgi:WD40 repeat protein